MSKSKLKGMRTNVGRNILQTSELFTHPDRAILEYVKNGYGYKDPKIRATVNVSITKEKYSIDDNGRGMSQKELNDNFLIMHGENFDRKQGVITDGFFGSGKSAAFGVGKILSVKTVQNGLLNHIEIHENDIKENKNLDLAPIRHIVDNEKADAPNGTLIEIKDLKSHAKKFDEKSIKKSITRAIKHKKDVDVWFQGELIEIIPPEIDYSREFNSKDYQPLEKHKLGNKILKISVAKSPLEKDDKGIAVYSKTIFLDNTLAGMDTHQHSHYITGEISVDELDNDFEINAYNQSRSGLNKSNPLVRDLFGFIGSSIQNVLQEIDENEKNKKKELNEKKLNKLASETANKINDYFKDQMTKSLKGIDKSNNNNFISSKLKEMFSKGEDESVIDSEANDERLLSDKKLKTKNDNNDLKNKNNSGNEKNAKKIDKPAKDKSGFSIQLRNLGEAEFRAKWVEEQNLILINTDHKQIKSVKDNYGVDSPFFRSLITEVAASECCYAMANILLNEKKLVSGNDALYYYREQLSEIAKIFSDFG